MDEVENTYLQVHASVNMRADMTCAKKTPQGFTTSVAQEPTQYTIIGAKFSAFTDRSLGIDSLMSPSAELGP